MWSKGIPFWNVPIDLPMGDARKAYFGGQNDGAPGRSSGAQQTVIYNRNALALLMDAVRVCSLGQITNALFEVGGQYRRSM